MQPPSSQSLLDLTQNSGAPFDPAYLLTTFLVLYAIIVLRYLLIAGLFHWALWLRDPAKVKARKLTEERPARATIRTEIVWSLISSAIYALPGAFILEAWKRGGTAIYTEVSAYGWLYLFASVAIYLFLHDTYFYWTHRWMHRPKVYRLLHRVHHQSRQPTPWAAFSFHPYEAVIGAVFIPALLFFIPLHVGALLFILIFMTVCSVINHTGYEIYPDSWLRGTLGRHFISAAHHNLHHQKFTCNYALYFRFWDKVMRTDVLETAYGFLAKPESTPAAAGTSEGLK